MELVILNGDLEGARFALSKGNITVGRKSGNDICMSLDPRISRFHAQLSLREDGRWEIEDLGSANGTFVGQRRIHAPTVIHPNDRFRMGRTWMTLYDDTPSVSQARAVQSVQLTEVGAGEFEVDNVVYSVSAERAARTDAELAGLRDRLAVYREVGRALTFSLDVNELLNAIMDAMMECLPAERGFLLLVDRETGEMVPRVARQRRDTGTAQEKATISRHILEKAVNERVTILTTDAMSDERFQEVASVRDLRIRSAVCAPLFHQENVLGVIYLDTTSATHVFTETDVDFVAGVASQAAVAIENARLYTDLRGAYDELQAAQQQLVRSEKLSTIGALSATVAHDMINITTPLQPLIDIMLRDADVDAESEEAVRRQTKRLSALAERLMSFSQSETTELVSADINTMVQNTLALLNTEFNHKSVKLSTHFGSGLPPVMADENQMERVFLNLCINALEAMDEMDGQELELRTFQDADEVVVSIADNGPGLPENLTEDIFEPFYTTKEHGTGLGLFSCRRIVQNDHNGVIEYESVPGQGTTFFVRLPVTPTQQQ
jgi:signal transduction histidine kinase